MTKVNTVLFHLAAVVAALVVAFAAIPQKVTPVHAGGTDVSDVIVTEGDVQDIDGMATTAVEALNEGTNALTKIALALLPIAVIALFIVLLFNHDAKTLKTQIVGLIIIIVALVGILMANSGAFINIAKNIAGVTS